MGLRSVPPGGGQHAVIQVVLIDEDPLSRQFLLAAFAQRTDLNVDEPHGSSVPPPTHDQVIVLVYTPDRPARVAQIRTLVAQGHRVLVIGVHWTPESLQHALEAGASGCIIKSLDIDGIAAAASAAVAGHVVVSPGLIPTYLRATNRADKQEPTLATDRAIDLLDRLTARELEILGLLGAGLATKEIATQLYVSAATVKSHVSHALTKLGVRNRVQAVLLVKELGLLELARSHLPESTTPSPDSDRGDHT